MIKLKLNVKLSNKRLNLKIEVQNTKLMYVMIIES